MASQAPNLLRGLRFCDSGRDSIRQAIAATFIGAICPKTSMAPVQAITDMVAGTAHRESFDPVGEIRTAYKPCSRASSTADSRSASGIRARRAWVLRNLSNRRGNRKMGSVIRVALGSFNLDDLSG